MALMLESPSRIWRRIEADDGRDMPSLPSLPPMDDSTDNIHLQESSDNIGDIDESLDEIASPLHSTPAISSHQTTRTFRGGVSSASMGTSSNTGSAARFANSIARSSRSSIARSRFGNVGGASLNSKHEQEPPELGSFDISAIPSLPDAAGQGSDIEVDSMDDLSDALESISRTSSPYPGPIEPSEGTPGNKTKYFDYEVSLKSEPKPSPFSKDKFRHIVTRRPALERTRTPSLTRTTLSPVSSPPTTPQSHRSGRSLRTNSVGSPSESSRSVSPTTLPPVSIPLSRPNINSPAVHDVQNADSSEAELDERQRSYLSSKNDRDIEDTASMDITDAHISPVRQFVVDESDHSENPNEGEKEYSSRDPTFTSSEGDGATPHPQRTTSPRGGMGAFSGLRDELSAFSSASLSPSVALATPTPALPRPRFAASTKPKDRQGAPRPRPVPAIRAVVEEEDSMGSGNEEGHAHEDNDNMIAVAEWEKTEVPTPQINHADEGDHLEPVDQLPEDGDYTLLTPHTRRKSFLLSVIHSTARPRPRLNKFPTPRPRQGPGNFEQRLLRNRGRDSISSVVDQVETPAPSDRVGVRFSEVIEDSPSTFVIQRPSVAPTPGLRTAFAGATPRPRFLKGSSHPLSQTQAADSSTTSEGANDVKNGSPGIEVTSESGIKDTILSPGGVEGEGTRPWGTQALLPGKIPSPFNKPSPYQASSSDTSFVSTASSHDLTAHPRANTSFDPALGFGGRTGTTAHGVGRFNANKLNNYLHSLNRRLQEENEKLVERLRRAEEQGKGNILPATSDISTSFSGVQHGRRRSSGTRRRISAGSALDDVKEEEESEQRDYAAWTEEKAELEAIIDAFKAEIDARALEKGVLERAVEVERAGFAAEKEEIERMIEEARKETELLAEEKDGLTKKNEEMVRVLEEEVRERARDKERWKERMSEVERGVESIVHDLEKKLESENRAHKAQTELERRIADAVAERDEALEREKKAAAALDAGAELGGELREANERLSRLMGQLRRANGRVEEVESLLSEADERVEKMEQKVRDLDALKEASVTERKKAEAQLDEIRIEVEAKKVEVRHLEDLNMRMEEELKGTKAYVNELEESAAAAVEQIQEKERELREVTEEIQRMDYARHDLEDQLEDAEKDKMATKELARQFEEALEAAEKKMEMDEEELVNLRGRITTLEQDKERQKDLSSRSMDLSRNSLPDAKDVAAEIEALEEELNDANKEIARLNTILNQSPARKAMDKAKDVRIEMLEKENEGLVERIKAMRITMNDFTMNTPGKLANHSSNISPFHRQVLAMTLKTPKTPGGPLRDMSWLNNTFAGDSSVAPLVAELSRLQRQLDRANESIDDKLDKLEDAGLGVVELTEKLENARSKIGALEDELSRLKRAEERRLQRLQRARCKKCLTKVDVGSLAQVSRHEEDDKFFHNSKDELPSEPPTPPTRTSEALKANLRSVNDQLAQMKKQWDDEKRQLQGEKDVLQDAANRLNIQIWETRDEVNRASERQKADSHLRQDLQSEIDKAKRTISSLEENLKIERARIRGMTAEQNRIAQEKGGVLSQLQRTESDMEDVKQQLLSYKKENREMENELRANANAEQRVRLLESKVKENTETMEQLREERALLVVEHKELQKKFTKISEQTQRLREQETSTKQTHENRRQQLDLHIGEINELRKALSDRAEELHRTEAEKERLAVEGNGVVQTVAALESDLRRVKNDAEAFGRDLKLLRAEKEKLERKHREETSRTERVKKQLQTQLKLLGEQLDEQKNKTAHARSELHNHSCAVDENQLANLKLQHNKECKGLIVQIRYLKAKFTRESMLRYDLAYQKQYLLVLLAKFEKSEQTIFVAIAKIGFPVPPAAQPKKRKKLRSIAFTVVFLNRLWRLSEEWRKQSASKQAIAAALQEVRQRRATTVT